MMNRIIDLAQGRKAYVVPTRVCDSLIEVSTRINGYTLSPFPSIARSFSMRSVFSRLKMSQFAASDEVRGKEAICRALADLSILNPRTPKWIIRCGSDFGWISTADIPLLGRMKRNLSILSSGEIRGEGIRQVIAAALRRSSKASSACRTAELRPRLIHRRGASRAEGSAARRFPRCVRPKGRHRMHVGGPLRFRVREVRNCSASVHS